MKFLALCVICGFLATSCNPQAVEASLERDTDESSDYSDLFDGAVRGMHDLLGNALDDNDSSDSDSNEDKIDSAIEQAMNVGNDYDDNSDEIEAILNTVQSLFDGTVLKLGKMGEGAVSEFFQSLRDLIGAFIDSEELEENINQALNKEEQNSNSNSQNVDEKELLNGNKQHEAEQADGTNVEKHTDGNTVQFVEQEANVQTEDSSQQDNTQNGNDENSINEK